MKRYFVILIICLLIVFCSCSCSANPENIIDSAGKHENGPVNTSLPHYTYINGKENSTQDEIDSTFEVVNTDMQNDAANSDASLPIATNSDFINSVVSTSPTTSHNESSTTPPKSTSFPVNEFGYPIVLPDDEW